MRGRTVFVIFLNVALGFTLFMCGQLSVKQHTVVVEYNYGSHAVMYGPYFGKCYTVGHKQYCATNVLDAK